ncbi:hypothetical protein HGA64_04985 [Candidatus Falkowbacteria bacterium]|nr:hypothetical protein [Candidatus Falkowbacteria bacterium]
MIIVAKKYIFRLLVLSLAIYAVFHWYSTYPINEPVQINNVFVFIKNDIALHWGQFKESVQNLQKILVQDINSDNKIRRGGMDRLAKALDLYKADNEKYPSRIDEASSWYKDYNEITTDPSFKYEPSTDLLHFTISINLTNGEIYSVQR